MGLLVLYSTLAIPAAMSEECGKLRRGAWAGLAELEEKGWVPRVSRAQDQGHSPAAPTFGSNKVSPVGGRTESSSPLLCPICAKCAPTVCSTRPQIWVRQVHNPAEEYTSMIIADPQRMVC